VHARLGIVDITVKEFTMIGIKHDLTNGRARAFGHHTVHNAFTFRHPSPWKTHFLLGLLIFLAFMPIFMATEWPYIEKSKLSRFIQSLILFI
jgi:hypothetical protein